MFYYFKYFGKEGKGHMLRNYNNWLRYPKMISLCFSVFTLSRIIIQLQTQENINLVFWMVSLVCGALLFIIFHFLNVREELKRLTNCSSYKKAKAEYNLMLKTVMKNINDKEMKSFIVKEMGYLGDEVKKYIFIKGIFSKLDEL